MNCNQKKRSLYIDLSELALKAHGVFHPFKTKTSIKFRKKEEENEKMRKKFFKRQTKQTLACLSAQSLQLVHENLSH